MNTPDAVTEKPPKKVSPALGEPPILHEDNDATDSDIAALLENTEPKNWFLRRSIWVGIALLIILITGFFYWQARRTANQRPSYTTQTVVRGDLTLSVTANGTIQPTRSINIGSELSGTVLKVNVDVNDIIKKGDVLVELDTSKLRDLVLIAKATLAAAIAKVAQTEATKMESTATLHRLEEVAQLSGGKVPSKTELDSGRATYARAVADDLSARSGVNNARAALSTAQINISKALISAPADGIVLTRAVDPGNAVAASLQAVTLFTVAEDLAKLRLWVYVDEADVGSVKTGQYATFTVSAYPIRNFPARITRVGFGSTITDNVVTYLTYLDVDNSDLILRPGMTATATITAIERKDVLMVPNAALRFMPTIATAAAKKGIASGMSLGPPTVERKRKGAADSASTANARQVWVLAQESKGTSSAPVSVAVMPGISNGHMTEIISGDLKVGMQVVTAQKTANAK